MLNSAAADLLIQAAEDGLTLPYSAEAIARFEQRGHIVCLTTGVITLNAANRRCPVTPLKRGAKYNETPDTSV